MGAVKNGSKFNGVAINGLVVNGFAKCGQVIYKKEEFDEDVLLFINKVAGISGVEKNALNTCVKSLKSASLYSKIKVFYPMVGGTANTTKLDFINANNNAFNIDWYGGLTFSSLGVKGNGQNGYGNSKFITSDNMVLENHGICFCIGTNTPEITTDPIMIGAFAAGNAIIFSSRYNSNNASYKNKYVWRLNSSVRTLDTVQDNNIYLLNRKKGIANLFISKIKVDEYTPDGSLPTSNILLLNMSYAGNTPYSNGYSQHRIQSTLFHEWLTDAEAITLQTIINQFEQDLGRKTW